MTNDRHYQREQMTVAVLCDDETHRSLLIRLISDAGYRPLIGASIDVLTVPPDILLVALHSNQDATAPFLRELELYLDNNRCEALICTALARLEEVYALLPQAHFIVDGTDDDITDLLARFLVTGADPRVREDRKEADFIALHRISTDLASAAQRLADIAEQTRPPAPSLALVPPTGPSIPAKPVTAADVRKLIHRRRLRDQYFGGDMLADPAWDMLLDLFAAGMEQKDVSVSSLCIAAAVPPTTALRWISAMTEAGMLIRRFDPNDGRRVFISLSDDANTRMQQYFANLDGNIAVI